MKTRDFYSFPLIRWFSINMTTFNCLAIRLAWICKWKSGSNPIRTFFFLQNIKKVQLLEICLMVPSETIGEPGQTTSDIRKITSNDRNITCNLFHILSNSRIEYSINTKIYWHINYSLYNSGLYTDCAILACTHAFLNYVTMEMIKSIVGSTNHALDIKEDF